jgi:hypothetical protein
MSAKNRRVRCDGCKRVGGMYGPTASAAGLASLRRTLAKDKGWTRRTGPRPDAPAWADRQETTLDLCRECS